MKPNRKPLKERLNTFIGKIALGKTFTTFVSNKCPLEDKQNQKKKTEPDN